MKNFNINIIDKGGIPPYIQVDFDGIELNKDVVHTLLKDTKGVDHVNINARGIDKYRAIVYPASYCDSLSELKDIINNMLNRL